MGACAQSSGVPLEAVLFLVSKNWLASEWCRKEHSIARGKNKALFAALVDDALTTDQLPETRPEHGRSSNSRAVCQHAHSQPGCPDQTTNNTCISRSTALHNCETALSAPD